MRRFSGSPRESRKNLATRPQVIEGSRLCSVPSGPKLASGPGRSGVPVILPAASMRCADSSVTEPIWSSMPSSRAGTTVSDISPRPFSRIGGAMQQGLDTRGGVWMNITNAAGTPLSATATSSTVRLMNSGVFETRVMLAAWPGDDLIADPLDAASELNTVLTTNLSRSGPIPLPTGFMSLTFGGGGTTLPVVGAEPRVLGVIDQGLRWPRDSGPWPLFSHSNPLAPVTQADASGIATTSTPSGRAYTSPSYRTTLAQPSAWSNLMQTSGVDASQAFGGLSQTSLGVTSAVYTEVPLAPPLSLAQYTHANFGVRDQQPFLSIGNSFASPLIDAKKALQDNGSNWSEFDQTYLLNAALWDGYFLSSLAPWMKTGATGAIAPTAPTPTNVNATTTTLDPNEAKSLTQVIEEFVNNDTPLDNPRFSIERSTLGATETANSLADYRRSAAVLLNKGAFNVNSTSSVAWQAFLGSAKKLAIADKGPSTPDDMSNARFPRVLAKENSSVAATTIATAVAVTVSVLSPLPPPPPPPCDGPGPLQPAGCPPAVSHDNATVSTAATADSSHTTMSPTAIIGAASLGGIAAILGVLGLSLKGKRETVT